ncbi:MAG: J domain-containing protein [Deltaproteobacteria bacterium]|nr:J domain-containing protein [Deltaproteobacteria bacterium]
MLSLVELETVKSVIGSLSHYQILKISTVASEDDIQTAFHREALLFHPDRYYAANDPKSSDLSKEIYAKVVNAYRTLSNRTKRQEYDRQRLASPSAAPTTKAKAVPTPESSSELTNRPQFSNEAVADDDENAITSIRPRPTGATAGAGSRFFKLAQTAFAARDFQSAKMNIQIALNTDSSNPEYLNFSQRIETELKKNQTKK